MRVNASASDGKTRAHAATLTCNLRHGVGNSDSAYCTILLENDFIVRYLIVAHAICAQFERSCDLKGTASPDRGRRELPSVWLAAAAPGPSTQVSSWQPPASSGAP